MGRRLRSRLDLLHPDLSGKVESKQWTQKLAHDTTKSDRKFKEGDSVYAEDFSATTEKWIPGVIQKVTGPLSYHIQLGDGRVIRRHVDSVRSRPGERTQPEDTTLEAEGVSPALQGVESTDTNAPVGPVDLPPVLTPPSPDPTPAIRRSARNRPPPSYYGHGTT